jgi:uncharacterized protein (TIGR00255 family)
MKIKTNSFPFGAGIASMTGFGRCEQVHPGLRISVELRTVNNRYCDIGLKIPRELNAVESEIRDHVRTRINRGRINLLVVVERDATDDLSLQIDAEAAKVCYQKLDDLNQDLGRPAPVTLGQLLHFSDLFTRTPERQLSGELKAKVFDTLDKALNDLIAMRRTEGLALARDLLVRIEQIDKVRREIEALAQEQPKLQFEKMKERLQQLLNLESLDPGRLEQEMALMSDRLDVTEECVRLKSHCDSFLDTLKGDDPAGKRLNFLVQELNREANTISAKSASADISHLAIGLKEEIERIREQIQNIE